MMFVGFVVTTAVAGQFLEPYSHLRLLEVTAGVALVSMFVTVLATGDLERRVASLRGVGRSETAASRQPLDFRAALRQVWNETVARRFTIFIFVSMLAYSGQELIFEPFAGFVFHLSPAQSTRLTSLQHGGALVGMLLVAVLGSLPARWRIGSLRGWMVGGCIASAGALVGLVAAGFAPAYWPLRFNVFFLGLGNGVFAVSAIGSMMSLVSAGGVTRQGIRMGLWGASQAVAFALGGVLSAAVVDVVRHFLGSPIGAYASVFIVQALLFLLAGVLALGIGAIALPRTESVDCEPAIGARGALKAS
jgi:BCD family chlorophyll transporter-like MFS transporter